MMLQTVGVIELKSIAKGIEACDQILKSAEIRLISAHTACPGKYEIIVTGQLSNVQIAIDRARETYSSYVIDSVVMGRIEESVIKALFGGVADTAKGAIGVVETFSGTSAIKAADTAVKAAAVEILEMSISRGMGGKGYIIVTGNIADVTAAVEHGSQYAKDQGLFAGSSILAAPHEDLWQYV